MAHSKKIGFGIGLSAVAAFFSGAHIVAANEADRIAGRVLFNELCQDEHHGGTHFYIEDRHGNWTRLEDIGTYTRGAQDFERVIFTSTVPDFDYTRVSVGGGESVECHINQVEIASIPITVDADGTVSAGEIDFRDAYSEHQRFYGYSGKLPGADDQRDIRKNIGLAVERKLADSMAQGYTIERPVSNVLSFGFIPDRFTPVRKTEADLEQSLASIFALGDQSGYFVDGAKADAFAAERNSKITDERHALARGRYPAKTFGDN